MAKHFHYSLNGFHATAIYDHNGILSDVIVNDYDDTVYAEWSIKQYALKIDGEFAVIATTRHYEMPLGTIAQFHVMDYAIVAEIVAHYTR